MSQRRTKLAGGFTLLELAVTLVVLTVLLLLLFPAVNHGDGMNRRGRAAHDVRIIVEVIKSYNTEYGRYPDVGATEGKDALLGDPAFAPGHPNRDLFDTLRAIPAGRNVNHILNPRKVILFEAPVAASRSAPLAGLGPKGSGAAAERSLFDPWGRQYGIVIDANYDGHIDVSAVYLDFPHPGSSPQVGAGSFAMGKDNQLGAAGDRRLKNANGVKSDDVVSWQ